MCSKESGIESSSCVHPHLPAVLSSSAWALTLNSRSSGAHSGSSGASSTCCSSARASATRVFDRATVRRERNGKPCCAGCTQRGAQMRFRTRLAAAKERRYFEIPPAQGAIGRALQELGCDAQDPFELVLDRAPVPQSVAKTGRLRKRTHVGGGPKVPFRLIRSGCDRLAAGLDATGEERAPLRRGRVATQPVIRTRELPRGFEIRGTLRQFGSPRVGRRLRAREVRAIGVQRVGGGVRQHRAEHGEGVHRMNEYRHRSARSAR